MGLRIWPGNDNIRRHLPGQSGSPMFGFWDDEVPDVVVVVSAHGSVWTSGTENWCAGGTDLGRLVRQARDENP